MTKAASSTRSAAKPLSSLPSTPGDIASTAQDTPAHTPQDKPATASRRPASLGPAGRRPAGLGRSEGGSGRRGWVRLTYSKGGRQIARPCHLGGESLCRPSEVESQIDRHVWLPFGKLGSAGGCMRGHTAQIHQLPTRERDSMPDPARGPLGPLPPCRRFCPRPHPASPRKSTVTPTSMLSSLRPACPGTGVG